MSYDRCRCPLVYSVVPAVSVLHSSSTKHNSSSSSECTTVFTSSSECIATLTVFLVVVGVVSSECTTTTTDCVTTTVSTTVVVVITAARWRPMLCLYTLPCGPCMRHKALSLIVGPLGRQVGAVYLTALLLFFVVVL